MQLTDRDQELMSGSEAQRLAMRILVRVGAALGATRLLDISSAHIDGCLYHGRAGIDFAERLLAGGARVAVPTTLNVATLDLLHPDLFRGNASTAEAARRLMESYEAMGCRPTWTCAPYQLLPRPGMGEHVAWAESNAIVFANSVLGARTARYGDFIDISAAITGRAPAAGLHLDEHRRATLVLAIDGLPDPVPTIAYPALGHLLGRLAGSRVVAITGLEEALPTEDDLKALGAAAASSGAVGLFHVIGVTPEAATLEMVSTPGAELIDVTEDRLRESVEDLTTVADGPIGAVSVGTPHASAAELRRLCLLIEGRTAAVPIYVNTGRDVLAEAGEDLVDRLAGSGVTVVTDTCTYITPILDPGTRVVMTDSAKWAYYAPGNLGVQVVFGTLEDCVASAERGRVVRTGWPHG